MPDPIARKRLKKKMLDRWENEGGAIDADTTNAEAIKPTSENEGRVKKLSSERVTRRSAHLRHRGANLLEVSDGLNARCRGSGAWIRGSPRLAACDEGPKACAADLLVLVTRHSMKCSLFDDSRTRFSESREIPL
jgi:hypothetical protein